MPRTARFPGPSLFLSWSVELILHRRPRQTSRVWAGAQAFAPDGARGRAAEYTDEEAAEMTAQHAGDGYDDSGNARPGSDEVLDAMENGTVRRNTGRVGTQQPSTKVRYKA